MHETCTHRITYRHRAIRVLVSHCYSHDPYIRKYLNICLVAHRRQISAFRKLRYDCIRDVRVRNNEIVPRPAVVIIISRLSVLIHRVLDIELCNIFILTGAPENYCHKKIHKEEQDRTGNCCRRYDPEFSHRPKIS